MKEKIETAVPRRKFVAGDSDEARKRLLGIAATVGLNRLRGGKNFDTFMM
jgi:predicted dinucleotide-binding enzyme